MKNISKLLILTITVSGFTSCNFKKAGRDADEAARVTSLTIESEDKSTETTISTQTKKAELSEISTNINNAKSVADLTKELSSLEARAINAETMMNVHANKKDETRKALTYYNYALISLAQIAPQSAELQTYMDKYEKMALAGCSIDMKGCLNYAFLKTDSRSSKVLQLIASNLDKKIDSECKTDCSINLKRYYNLLSLTFDVNNYTRNAETEFLYIKRAKQYGDLLLKSGDLTKFRNHGTIFENIIAQYAANANDERFTAFVQDFKPWKYSRLNPNSFPFGAQKMFSFAASNYLYNADQTALRADVKATIDESQAQADKAGPSFKMIVNQLKTDARSSGIFKGLNLDISIADKSEFYNEYFFMVDRLYRGHLGIEEAASFWNGSKKDAKALLSVVDFYTKIEFLRRIFETNQYLAEIFMRRNNSSETMFKQVVQESESLTKQWNSTFSRMENISIFVSQQLNSTKENSEDLKEVQLMIDTVKRNATFLSVYPNMLLMSYFMLDTKSSVTFTTWWGGEVSVDPATVMNQLLDGQLTKPWFLFGGTTETLNKIELIYAFHYALNTGSFETFAKIPGDNGLPVVDRVSFFKKALQKTAQIDMLVLDEAHKKLSDLTSNSDYDNFLQNCASESQGNKDYSVLVKLTELQNFAIFGNENQGMLTNIHALYAASGPLRKFNEIRLSLESRLVQLRSMMDVLQYNLSNLANAPADLKQVKAELQAEIDGLEKRKQDFLIRMVAQHKAVSKCLNTATRIERERQSVLFTSEIKHLEQVYDELVVLNALSGPDKKAQIEASAAKLGLENLNSIADSSYTYSTLSLLNRLAKTSQQLKPFVNFVTPDKSEQDSLRSSLQKVNFMNPATNQMISKNEFVNAGMSLLSSQGSNTLRWLQVSASVEGWKEKLTTMVSLYKMGFDSNLQNNAKNSVTASEIISEAIEMAQYLNITDAEKLWLLKMGRRDRIAREKVNGILFQTSDNEFKGILDNYYREASEVKPMLDLATQYYVSSKEIGRFLFPVPDQVLNSMKARYTEIVKRSENIVKDFETSVKTAEKSFNSDTLKITYRLDDAATSTYTTKLIDGGDSILLDSRRIRDVKGLMTDFRVKKTACEFQNLPKNVKCD